MIEKGEVLRGVMRQWASGVAVATSKHDSQIHGMTVNSFTSISIDPPIVTVTLAKNTRTHELVVQSGVFGITILSAAQEELSERFAGKIPEQAGRLAGLETFTLLSGVPLLKGGIGFLDCKVIHQYTLPSSTLFVGEVLAAQAQPDHEPLLYFNRGYHRLEL